MNKLIKIGIALSLLSGLGFLMAIWAYIDAQAFTGPVIAWGAMAVAADLACVGCFMAGAKARQKPPREYR